ncbi:nucleotide-diphospho-sugar transferase-domain-containing protein [Gorgonomyces haynaldii]|nr:nucleotide-diphospho-sugar transferase-domain-containing protein [Gorgonomyces haynaldii]
MQYQPKIDPKPAPLSNKGLKLFVNEDLKRIPHLRYRTTVGYKYCEFLEQAVVDQFQGHRMTPQLIDAMARNLTAYVYQKFPNVHPHEAQRYACHAAIVGSNPVAQWTSRPYLARVDPVVYLNSKIKPLPLQNQQVFKLAYLILLVDGQGFSQLQSLLNKLDDGSALIMVHVPLGLDATYKSVQDLVNGGTKPIKTIYLQTNRYPILGGHSNNLFALLAGLFELQGLGKWDYVINLSNYDWPLRRNSDIHKILAKRKENSWIDFWIDHKSFAQWILRPTLVSKDNTELYHPPELGMAPHLMHHWQPYRQSPWMILSSRAVSHLKSNESILFLSQVEFTLNAMESFFATVFLNDQKMRDLVQPDKKRYVRTSKSGQLQWIGFKDRYIFPPGSEDPTYLFMGPFNSVGSYFGENKMVDWIEINHMQLTKAAPCRKEQLGFRDECIRELVLPTAENDDIILIALNSAYLKMASNLRCSLAKLGMKNVIHWALDEHAHETLMEEQLVSYFAPLVKGSQKKVPADDPQMVQIMRNKPIILRKLLNAGFNVWYLDADTVALGDFRKKQRIYTKLYQADVLFSQSAPTPISPARLLLQAPLINAGIAYFSANSKTVDFLSDVISLLEADRRLTDQDAFQMIINQRTIWTGIGSTGEDEYSENSSEDESDQDTASERCRVHFLDSQEFPNGQLYFDHPNLLTKEIKIVHSKAPATQEKLSEHQLWFLDKDSCLF